MRLKKISLLVAIIVSFFALQSCSNDEGISSSRVQLKLIDAPGDYIEVNVEIIDIQSLIPFDLQKDISKSVEKMTRRHPHVFGDEKGTIQEADKVVDRWEQVKAEEKKQKGESEAAHSVFKTHFASISCCRQL